MIDWLNNLTRFQYALAVGVITCLVGLIIIHFTESKNYLAPIGGFIGGFVGAYYLTCLEIKSSVVCQR